MMSKSSNNDIPYNIYYSLWGDLLA